MNAPAHMSATHQKNLERVDSWILRLRKGRYLTAEVPEVAEERLTLSSCSAILWDLRGKESLTSIRAAAD
jgi:hypothetical protein